MTFATDRKATDHPPSKGGGAKAGKLARADRAKRQNALLDEGLKETFPASDPVSVARVT